MNILNMPEHEGVELKTYENAQRIAEIFKDQTAQEAYKKYGHNAVYFPAMSRIGSVVYALAYGYSVLKFQTIIGRYDDFMTAKAVNEIKAVHAELSIASKAAQGSGAIDHAKRDALAILSDLVRFAKYSEAGGLDQIVNRADALLKKVNA